MIRRLIAALTLSLAAACAAPKTPPAYPTPEPLEQAFECVNRTDGSARAVEFCLCWVQSDQSDAAAERCSGESY